MKCPFSTVGAAALVAALSLAGCFSSAPPAPVVRWFDPTPRELPAPPAGLPSVRLRVMAPPHLGRELAYRIGDREFTFDADQRWIAEPSALLQAALARGVPVARDGSDVMVELERFEFDLVSEPRARVQFTVHTLVPGLGELRLESVQSASARTVDALVTAMALALVDSTAQVQRALAPKR